MNRRGHKGRVDQNHAAIMQALRDNAMECVSIASVGGGCPDILVGFRGLNVALEVKTDHKAPLTAGEQGFRDTWPGQYAIVTTGEEAVDAVLIHAKLIGAI